MRGKSHKAFWPVREKYTRGTLRGDLTWRELLHPANAYSHPRAVLADKDLTLSEKRAILASWASDASAVVSNPALRHAPSSDRPVTFDEIMDALRSLDTLISPESDGAKKLARSSSPWRWPPNPDEQHRTQRGA